MLQNEGTFYLIENTPKFTKFMSEPIRAQQVSSPLDTPGYFVAGIVKGYLVSSGFPAEYALTPDPPCSHTSGLLRPPPDLFVCCNHRYMKAVLVALPCRSKPHNCWSHTVNVGPRFFGTLE